MTEIWTRAALWLALLASLLPTWLHWSVAKQVMHHATCAVLVAR